MSRIGKQPIELENGVSAIIEKRLVKITGPKGNLSVDLPSKILVEQKDNQLIVSVPNPEDSRQVAFWGLGRSLIANAVEGVTKGFEKKLEINGVGYKAVLKGSALVFNLGYSHIIEFNVPEGVSAQVEGNVITVSGIDKQLIGETAAQIRALRKPEPYKGKGIKYSDEQIRRKVGKMVKGAEGK
ncbi:MAG: 50S ribosomal protein L6 [Parcubacteria group bacterium CG1_02_41_12]|nr:MAG: 50S ribosomal protein L6 [Parcubacteria group bacterium CG1_02_41_12]PIR57524.1 MAG: 50S ribosomal protein L6 [Parcubacteria group bacterium CG10_big_fil_rev_8_21_14_0_10_41_35]